jgi:hypothetical protein
MKNKFEIVQCPFCKEYMQADHGPDKTPYHIKKGTIKACPGNWKKPMNYYKPVSKKK